MEQYSDKKQMLYGRHPVLEALKAGQNFERVFVQKGAGGDEVREISSRAHQHKVPVQYVPPAKLNRLTKKNHQGVVGILSYVHYYEVEDILMQVYDKGEAPFFIVLDGITDVRNFGAIARTAECAGAHALIVPFRGAAQINAEAMKASAGALNNIAICRHKNLGEALDYLKLNGVKLLAAEMEGSVKLQDLDMTVPVAIILGSEGEGVDPRNLKLADERFHIPMFGKIDSYNVSVSAGIIMYEAIRQRSAE